MARISKRSYVGSVYLHLSFLIFIIIPVWFFASRDKDHHSSNIEVMTISLQDFNAIVKNNIEEGEGTVNTLKQLNKSQIKSIESPKLEKKDINKQVEQKKEALLLDNILSDVDRSTILKRRVVRNKTKTVGPNNMNDTLKNSVPNVTSDRKNTLAKEYQEKRSKKDTTIDSKIDEITFDNLDQSGLKGVKNEGIFSEYGSVETISNHINISPRDLIMMQISRCWNEFHDDREMAQNVVVTLIVSYTINGSVSTIQIVEKASYSNPRSKSIYSSMVRDAKQAVMNCNPIIGLSPKNYNQWRQMRFNFQHMKNQ